MWIVEDVILSLVVALTVEQRLDWEATVFLGACPNEAHCVCLLLAKQSA